MHGTSRIALLSLAVALLLGVMGDQLILRAPDLGLGGFLWVAALAAGTAALSRWGRVAPSGVGPLAVEGDPPSVQEAPAQRGATLLQGEGRWLLAGAVLFAAGLVWRSSPMLQFLDLLAIGICLGLAALTLRGGSLSQTGVLSYPLGLALSFAHHLIGPFSLLFADIGWRELPRGNWSKQVAAVLRGLLIAIPLLLLFGGLFTAADAVFDTMVGGLFHFNLGRLTDYLPGILFFGALAAGFLRTSLIREPAELPRLARSGGLALGPIETGLILGLLNLLFLAFVLVQLRYLFGGAALVQAATDLTYAEYARRGFFELVQVSALVLPVLLGLHWLIPPERSLEQRLFRWLGGSLVGLLFVIIASALQRMWLYQQEYGLTELRLYTTAFMGWMALLFLWFLATVLRGQRERFALGALVSGLLVLAGLHAINPDGLIVRTNLERMAGTDRFDATYAASLGPDAIPALVSALPHLPEADRQQIVGDLQERSRRWAEGGWRAWNWGRTKAQEALSALPADLP